MPATIIDCHTHPFPPELNEDPHGWAKANKEPHWASLVAPHNRPSIQDWASPDRMLADMDAAGVQQAVLLGWYWENEASCRWHNAIIAEWVKSAPDRFIGFAAINPTSNVIDQLEAAAALGLCGVGELHQGVQKFDASSAGWNEIAQWCSKNKWPINLHVTGVTDRQHPDAVATPVEAVIELARSAPEAKLILAHWGGGISFLEADNNALTNLDNVYLDCSASPLLYSTKIFREVINLVGQDKILFGSDYPLRLFPRAESQANCSTYLNYIREECRLDAQELEALTGENFKRLLSSKSEA